MPWLNVDKVTKKAVIHIDSCSFIRAGEKREEDGAWYHYSTKDQAFEAARLLPSPYKFKGCGHCIR